MKDENVKRMLAWKALDEDRGSCPYYLKNGKEGAHGVNTCSFGCYDEPSCMTDEPNGGWIWPQLPETVRDWLNDWENHDEDDSDAPDHLFDLLYNS